ncbi:Fmr1 [Symbiodinium sp. CCMP2592]|nr:Fmr1 [Symbiodinium sp. CCMP2592]
MGWSNVDSQRTHAEVSNQETLHPIITAKRQASAMAQTVITTQQDALGQALSRTHKIGDILGCFTFGKAADRQPSIYELLDELISFDRSTLTKILAVCASTLLLVSSMLIYQEVAAGRTDLAMIYGGFFLLVIGLVASVAFVLHETSQLEAVQKAEKKGE